MQIQVIATIGEARSDDLLRKTVIVIDVLRATSTIITALDHGCKDVAAVESIMQAKDQQLQGNLFGGERFCKKIPGFDFGNSPLEYRTAAVQGKRLIMTTTNGTRGIQKAAKAEYVLAGAFINGRACAQAALELQKDVVIVCAGTQDVFSLEDGLCAGQLVDEISKLQSRHGVEVNDFGLAMYNSFLQARTNIAETLLNCSNGKRLGRIGFYDDVIYCSQLNVTSTVPILREGVLVPYSSVCV